MAPQRPRHHTEAMTEHRACAAADRPVALVTGAAHGLGLEVATRLAPLGAATQSRRGA